MQAAVARHRRAGVFGVLTVDDREQALDRVGGSEGHKGEEAANTAIEIVRLLQQL